MAIYQINEGVFEVPDGFEDKSVNVFLDPNEQYGRFGLVITRDNLESGEEAESYVERQLAQLSANLSEFQPIDQRKMTVDYLPAFEAEFTWRSETGAMIQRQVYLFYDQRVLVLTATTSGQFSEYHEWIIGEILSSFSLRG